LGYLVDKGLQIALVIHRHSPPQFLRSVLGGSDRLDRDAVGGLFHHRQLRQRIRDSRAGFSQLPALRRAATGPDANEQQTEGMAYGDPARIIRAVKKWESLGVDCINFILNANEVVPQDQVMASLRLFAKEVMPHFAKKPGHVAAAAGE